MKVTLSAENVDFWMRWVDDCDTARVRRFYGFPSKTVRRSQDPVIAHAAAQGKVVYRVSAEGATIYSPLSVQEWAKWHSTSVSTARKAMILLFIEGDDDPLGEAFKEVLRATTGRYDEQDGSEPAIRRKARSVEALWRKHVPAPRQVTDREWREALTTAVEGAEKVAEEWESIWRMASERAETWESISRMADKRADQQQTAAEKWKAIAEKWEETWRMGFAQKIVSAQI